MIFFVSFKIVLFILLFMIRCNNQAQLTLKYDVIYPTVLKNAKAQLEI